MTQPAQPKKNPAAPKPRCGLCGKTRKLIRTECCGNWICDDEGKYVVFSYARNSCSRNHRRYTLCGFHHTEGHQGDWKTCKKCRTQIEPEMVSWYGTNEYNFEKLPDPPAFEPKKCSKCGAIIVKANGGFSYGRDGYKCGACLDGPFLKPGKIRHDFSGGSAKGKAKPRSTRP